ESQEGRQEAQKGSQEEGRQEAQEALSFALLGRWSHGLRARDCGRSRFFLSSPFFLVLFFPTPRFTLTSEQRRKRE
ncbi:MAG TPA: hypothetical protein VMJ13_11305, partial [Candidatus Acidoferrum sp.]|nr:hypothetical protein [Candidatus Acidoferrum sp.]